MSKIGKVKKRSVAPKNDPLLIDSASVLTDDMLSAGQLEASKRIRSWFVSGKPKQPIYRIGALAGAGKSTLIAYLISKYGFTQSECYVMAYTGQAVNRLRSDGILANTIHSAIMVPHEEFVRDRDTGKVITRRGVPLTKVTFKPVKRLPSSVKLLIIDEASFLPEDLENILARYGIPILEFGDYFQLPPVTGRQVFTADTIDYFMEGVMRHNTSSEIFDLANRIRYRKNVDPTLYSREVLFAHQGPTVEDTFGRYRALIEDADVVITSTNKQRQIITDLYREKILKTRSPYPIAGERMICRHNNRNLMLDQYMLTNGTQGVCREPVGKSLVDKSAGLFYMDFEPDVVAGTGLYHANMPCDIEFLHKPFGANDLVSFKRPGEKMEYAHAITAHLGQGAQWNTVIFMDSNFPDQEYLARLRYTAVTRAIKRLIYMIPHSRYFRFFDLRDIEERLPSID